MATAIVPKIYDPELADENLEIATEDAYAMCRRIGRDCGFSWGFRPRPDRLAALESPVATSI